MNASLSKPTSLQLKSQFATTVRVLTIMPWTAKTRLNVSNVVVAIPVGNALRCHLKVRTAALLYPPTRLTLIHLNAPDATVSTRKHMQNALPTSLHSKTSDIIKIYLPTVSNQLIQLQSTIESLQSPPIRLHIGHSILLIHLRLNQTKCTLPQIAF